jgi:hypothetical protein
MDVNDKGFFGEDTESTTCTKQNEATFGDDVALGPQQTEASFGDAADESPSADDPPLQLAMHPLELRVTRQPPLQYFQCREGPLLVSFQTNGNEDDLQNAHIQLLYENTYTPVDGDEPVVVMARSVYGGTVHYQLKINPISKNHVNRAFCLCLTMGSLLSVVTQGFLVKTKRTMKKLEGRPAKRKRKNDTVDTKYQQRSRAVIASLQWRISGYVSHCEGFVDFSCPIWSCPLCQQTKDAGHTTVCEIHLLL